MKDIILDGGDSFKIPKPYTKEELEIKNKELDKDLKEFLKRKGINLAGFDPNQVRDENGQWGSGGASLTDEEIEMEKARKIAEDFKWDGDEIKGVMIHSLTESNFHKEVREIREALGFTSYTENLDYAVSLAEEYEWNGDSLISLMIATLTESNFHGDVKELRKLFPNIN